MRLWRDDRDREYEDYIYGKRERDLRAPRHRALWRLQEAIFWIRQGRYAAARLALWGAWLILRHGRYPTTAEYKRRSRR